MEDKAAPVPKQASFLPGRTGCLPLTAPPAPLGCVSFSPGLCQHVQKAMSRLVAISYCSNPPDRCAVDKPSVKAACKPD